MTEKPLKPLTEADIAGCIGSDYDEASRLKNQLARQLLAVMRQLKESEDALASAVDWTAQLSAELEALKHDIGRVQEVNTGLLGENEALRKALAYYAAESNWIKRPYSLHGGDRELRADVEWDEGRIAREALHIEE